MILMEGWHSRSRLASGLSGTKRKSWIAPITRASAFELPRSSSVYRQSCFLSASLILRSHGISPTPRMPHRSPSAPLACCICESTSVTKARCERWKPPTPTCAMYEVAVREPTAGRLRLAVLAASILGRLASQSGSVERGRSFSENGLKANLSQLCSGGGALPGSSSSRVIFFCSRLRSASRSTSDFAVWLFFIPDFGDSSGAWAGGAAEAAAPSPLAPLNFPSPLAPWAAPRRQLL
mmetsp:Transcript_30647/g.72291  ORF Transcript_30647/g.72291 Transcript_30647/m.72291 type:complete len:237 (+) Transcript_30647:1458-2168(+)